MTAQAASSDLSNPTEQLQRILERIADEVEGIRTVVVGDRSGLPIASLVQGQATMSATAMATMVLTAARNVATNMGLEELVDVLIEGKAWTIVVRSLGEGFTMLLLVDGDANLGLVKIQTERRANEIREVLEELR